MEKKVDARPRPMYRMKYLSRLCLFGVSIFVVVRFVLPEDYFATKGWIGPKSNARHAQKLSALDQWINTEKSTAWNKIFEQTGPPAGADEGLVIASPSKDQPDYFYTWTRDSAIVTSTVLHRLRQTHDSSLESNLRLYAYSQARLQKSCNPSGCFENGGLGLGEPKFHVNGSAFTGDWGRPQRDGPALRAITLAGFANYLMDRGRPEDVLFVRHQLYISELPALSVLKADLEYVAHHWHESSWDLWEEIDGYHFFTFICSRTALINGAILASRLGDEQAAAFYTSKASIISKKLKLFISQPPNPPVILASLNSQQWNRTGLDAAVLLGVLIANESPANEWGAAHDIVLATIKAYVDSFRYVYRINGGEKRGPAATGRYAEDVYDGIRVSLGNPWYLTTLTVPHVLFLASSHFYQTGESIVISVTNAAFWSDLVGEVPVGTTWQKGSQEWKAALEALEKWSDGFWEVARRYQEKRGELAEQFNRDTGLPQGAHNLTWSYSAFINAEEARQLHKRSKDLW